MKDLVLPNQQKGWFLQEQKISRIDLKATDEGYPLYKKLGFEQLSDKAKDIIENADMLFVSKVSLWEIAIKQRVQYEKNLESGQDYDTKRIFGNTTYYGKIKRCYTSLYHFKQKNRECGRTQLENIAYGIYAQE